MGYHMRYVQTYLNDHQEASVEKTLSERTKLAAHYESMKAAQSLVDVKYFLSNEGEATTEQVCREVNEMYLALERGDAKALDFGDRSVH